MTDVKNLTLKKASAVKLSANSGNWIVRNPSHPYSETVVIKQVRGTEQANTDILVT